MPLPGTHSLICERVVFINVQIDSLQNDLTVKAFDDIPKLNQFLFFHITFSFLKYPVFFY